MPVFSARISAQALNAATPACLALQGLATQERQLRSSGNFCQLPENQRLSLQGHTPSWTQLATSPILHAAREKGKAKAAEGLLQTRARRAGAQGVGAARQGGGGARATPGKLSRGSLPPAEQSLVTGRGTEAPRAPQGSKEAVSPSHSPTVADWVRETSTLWQLLANKEDTMGNYSPLPPPTPGPGPGPRSSPSLLVGPGSCKLQL